MRYYELIYIVSSNVERKKNDQSAPGGSAGGMPRVVSVPGVNPGGGMPRATSAAAQRSHPSTRPSSSKRSWVITVQRAIIEKR